MKPVILKGTSIILRLPQTDRDGRVPPGLRKFDGWVLKVSRIIPIRQASGAYGDKYFELEGCESKYGVPYAINPDWCIKCKVQGYGGFKP